MKFVTHSLFFVLILNSNLLAQPVAKPKVKIKELLISTKITETPSKIIISPEERFKVIHPVIDKNFEVLKSNWTVIAPSGIAPASQIIGEGLIVGYPDPGIEFTVVLSVLIKEKKPDAVPQLSDAVQFQIASSPANPVPPNPNPVPPNPNPNPNPVPPSGDVLSPLVRNYHVVLIYDADRFTESLQQFSNDLEFTEILESQGNTFYFLDKTDPQLAATKIGERAGGVALPALVMIEKATNQVLNGGKAIAVSSSGTIRKNLIAAMNRSVGQ